MNTNGVGPISADGPSPVVDNPDIEVVGSENDGILDGLDAQKGSTLARQNAASP